MALPTHEVTNQVPPVLRAYDSIGRRTDEVEYDGALAWLVGAPGRANVVADLTLESEAAAVLALRLAEIGLAAGGGPRLDAPLGALSTGLARPEVLQRSLVPVRG